MNKKLFLGMFVAASMLFATSCSNDDLETVQSGNEAQVTFSLGLENGIGGRAISDGTGAKKLVYAVYNANGELIKTIKNADANGQFVNNNAFNNNREASVELRLAKGQQYTVAFWAQNPSCTAYTTTDLTNVTVNYAGLNNDETRDAFFKAETFTVTGDATIPVVLKRPFAQINVGVYEDDWEAAKASEIEIKKSKVTIAEAATSINLLTGKVDGKTTVEYDLATIPTEKLFVDLDKNGTKEDYVYLSMSYILANDGTETGSAKTTLEDLEFTFAPETGKGNNIIFNAGLSTVPVQRNWRTNIIGYILTGNLKFNITIDPIYDGEYNNGKAQPVNINGVYYATIQDAVNAVKTGEVINVATGTYEEVVKVAGGKNFTLQAAGPDVVVAGLDHQSNGTPSTVKVKGITFDNSNIAGWFTGTSQNIAPCVGAWGGKLTFEDCAFIVAGTSGKETGVMTWWTTQANVMSLSFNNCTFEGKNDHANARAMQIYGYVNMEVSNCTFNTKKDYTLKYVAQSGNEATFSNNIVNNSENFVELGSSAYPGNGYTANIINNTLGKDVNTHVIANSENQIVNVNGNVSVIAEGLTKDANGNYIASSNDGIASALQLGASTVTLEEGEYKMPIAVQGKTVTISGTKEVIVNVNKDGTDSQHTSGATITFEGVTIQGAPGNYRGFPHTQEVFFKNCTIKNLLFLFSKTTFDNCTFETSSTEHCVWTYGSKEVKFKDCKFSYSDRCVNVYLDNGTENANVAFENCVFTTTASGSKGAVEINSSAFPLGVNVDFTGCVKPAYGEMVFISGWDSANGANATVTIDGTTATVPQLAK